MYFYFTVNNYWPSLKVDIYEEKKKNYVTLTKTLGEKPFSSKLGYYF